MYRSDRFIYILRQTVGYVCDTLVIEAIGKMAELRYVRTLAIEPISYRIQEKECIVTCGWPSLEEHHRRRSSIAAIPL
jgi:hypothetical protein